MRYIVYLDVFIAENFLIDLWLLYLTAKLLHIPMGKRQLFPAAVVGTMLSGMGLWMYPIFHSWSWIISEVGFLLILGNRLPLQPFREKARWLLIFLGLSVFLGGVYSFVFPFAKGWSFPFSLLASLGAGRLLQKGLERHRGMPLLSAVVLVWKGKQKHLLGLWDTGNRLVTPDGQKKVHVASPSVLGSWGQEKADSLLWIPYQSVGKECGVLFAVEMDELWVEGKLYEKKPVIAFSDHPVSREECYQILLQIREE